MSVYLKLPSVHSCLTGHFALPYNYDRERGLIIERSNYSSPTYIIDTEGGINGHCQRLIHCYISQSERNNDGSNGQIHSCLIGWLEQSVYQEHTVTQSLDCVISRHLLPTLQVREETGRQGDGSCYICKYLHCSLQGFLRYGSVEANCLLEWSQIDIECFSLKGFSSDVLNLQGKTLLCIDYRCRDMFRKYNLILKPPKTVKNPDIGQRV